MGLISDSWDLNFPDYVRAIVRLFNILFIKHLTGLFARVYIIM